MNGYQFIFSTMHTAISNFPNYLQRNQYPTHTPQLIKQITQTHTLKKSTRGNTPFRTNLKKDLENGNVLQLHVSAFL